MHVQRDAPPFDIKHAHSSNLQRQLALQVGKIKDVRVQGKNGQVNIQVAWFYRPEEATGGRKVGDEYHSGSISLLLVDFSLSEQPH